MSREFVLVPKAKYESLLGSLNQETEQPSTHISTQKGGQNDITESLPEPRHVKDAEEANNWNPQIPSKSPNFYIKSPLSEMGFLSKNKSKTIKAKKKTKFTTKPRKWINYTIH